jgi:hypothetical protein
MNSLNRETTIPNFLPVALRSPSIALSCSGREAFLFCFAVTVRLLFENYSDLLEPVADVTSL